MIACVGRGGTYMLNIGPRGDGSVPERAARDWCLKHVHFPSVLQQAVSVYLQVLFVIGEKIQHG